MADLSITAGTTGLGASGTPDPPYVAGEILTHLQPIYRNADDGLYYKAECGDTEAKAEATHITITAAAAGDRVVACKDGELKFGAILTKGSTYVVSSNGGGIMLESDLTVGQWITRLGTAKDTSTLQVNIEATGIQHP